MTPTTVRIADYRPEQSTEAELSAWHDLMLTCRRVDQPGYPPLSRQLALAPLTAEGPEEVRAWTAHHDETLAGAVILVLWSDENAHLVKPTIRVRPRLRRRGIGRALANTALAHARRAGRTTAVIDTRVGTPGELFAAALGFTPVLSQVTNLLRMSDVDRSSVQTWAAGAEAKTDGLRLIRWEAHLPDEFMEAFLDARVALDDMPTEDLDVRAERPTAAMMRQYEDAALDRGVRLYGVSAYDPVAERMAGFTTVHVEGDSPWANVGTTAVRPDYRGRGLGLWVKAAMLDWLLTREPHVTGHLTGNATANQHMRRINERLGYRVLEEERVWQRTL
jgi:GNAT superfamily N-acetyltransferase